MDDHSQTYEAAATLPVLRWLIAIQIASQLLVVGDRVVRYGLRWSFRASYKRAWFGWENIFDLFALVSLQFTMARTKANNTRFHLRYILFFGHTWSSVSTGV